MKGTCYAFALTVYFHLTQGQDIVSVSVAFDLDEQVAPSREV